MSTSDRPQLPVRTSEKPAQIVGQPAQIVGQPQIVTQPVQVIGQPVIIMGQNFAIPFDVSTALDQFSRVFVAKDHDFFRSVHCFEQSLQDYIVYGELPDGDKKLLFTSRRHFQCCTCCDDCIITCCCCEYACCNKIIFQMDYKRNNANFYTQGFNIIKGCHCCKCHCCSCCCPQTKLYLRENVSPESPNVDVGLKKGKTVSGGCCCCGDKTIDYVTEQKLIGHTIRLTCCEMCKNGKWRYFCLCCFPFNLLLCFCGCKDIEMSIEKPKGFKTGNIIIPNGIFSQRKEVDNCCFLPRHHYEVNFPAGIASEEKFQIIAQVIHFDVLNGLL